MRHPGTGARAAARLSLVLRDSTIAIDWAGTQAGHAALTAELAALASTTACALTAVATDAPSGVENAWTPATPDERMCLAGVAILAAAPETGVDVLLDLIGPERSLGGMWSVTAGLLAEVAVHLSLTDWETYELAAALRDEDPSLPANAGDAEETATSGVLHAEACTVLDALDTAHMAGPDGTRPLLSDLARLEPFPSTCALVLACGARVDALRDGADPSCDAALYLPRIA